MTPYRYVPSTSGQVVDMLGAMALCLPNHRLPNSKLDMAGEFALLRESLEFIRPKIGVDRYDKAVEISHEAEALYIEGDANEGGWRLNDIQALISRRR